MRKKGIYLMASALLSLTACTDDFEDPQPVPVRLETVLDEGSAQTRNQTTYQATELASGQPVGVYIYYTGNTSTTDSYAYKNIGYTVSGNAGNLGSPTSQPYYPPNANQEVDIYAFAPRTVWASVTDELSALTATTLFSVSTSQGDSNGTGYKASDFVWGMVTSKAATDKNTTKEVPLKHKMAKIIVNLTEGNGMSGRLAGATVKVLNTITAAKINLTTGAVTTNGSTKNDITIGSSLSVSNGKATCNGVIVPQTVAKGTAFITITLPSYGNTVYTYKLPAAADMAFASENSYTYDVTVNATDITLTTTISNWTAKTGDNAGKASYQ